MLAIDNFWIQVVVISRLTIKRIKTENIPFELIEGAIPNGKKQKPKNIPLIQKIQERKVKETVRWSK